MGVIMFGILITVIAFVFTSYYVDWPSFILVLYILMPFCFFSMGHVYAWGKYYHVGKANRRVSIKILAME